MLFISVLVNSGAAWASVSVSEEPRSPASPRGRTSKWVTKYQNPATRMRTKRSLRKVIVGGWRSVSAPRNQVERGADEGAGTASFHCIGIRSNTGGGSEFCYNVVGLLARGFEGAGVVDDDVTARNFDGVG